MRKKIFDALMWGVLGVIATLAYTVMGLFALGVLIKMICSPGNKRFH